MTPIGRLFVRGTALAGAAGAAVVIALAPQPGVAITHTVDEHSHATQVLTVQHAPSAACAAARTAFVTALKADVAEDATERNLVRAGTVTDDPTEDQAEKANFKSLFNALVSACKPAGANEHPTTKPAPSAACTSARAALQSYLTQLRAQEKTEWANHTEGTDADRAEDQATFAQLKTLFQAVAASCGFKTFSR